MGCVGRILYAIIIGLFAVTFGLGLLVIGSAGTLGEAAIVSADDLLVLFFLNLASLGGWFVLVLLIWRGHRLRKRQEQSIIELRNKLSAASHRSIPNAQSQSAASFQPLMGPQVRFCGSCGSPVDPTDTVCGNCGDAILGSGVPV